MSHHRSRRFVPSLLCAALLFAAPLVSQAATRGFEVRDMVNLDRVSEPLLSPDGKSVLYALRETDFAANKGLTGLWVQSLNGGGPLRLTPKGESVNSGGWSQDGSRVLYLSSKSGSQQLWSVPATGGAARQLSNYPIDLGSYKLSPDGRAIALNFEVFNDCDKLACSKQRLDAIAKNKASGKLFDALFIRHWDTWANGARNQLYTARFHTDGALSGEPVKVSRGIDGDIPSKPFGDTTEFTWAPDGKSLAFGVRIAGKSEPWSTNFDLYLVPANGSAPPRNLTAANKAWDAGPAFSPDGKTLYYRAMKRPGFEADRFALMAMDLKSGKSHEIDPQWDRSADGITLSDDGKTIYTQAEDVGEHPLFAIDIASGKVRKIVAGGNVVNFDLHGNALVYALDTMASPARLFVADSTGANAKPVGAFNTDKLKDIAFGAFEQFEFTGWNGETVHGYVVKPWNYKKGKKYPVAFLIHGGPQGSFGNGWSYRWNPQTYAGQGFAVVMVDFHGSTGYGQAFTDAISQHWGDRPLEDLQKGWAAALQKYSFLDGGNACALGASYGGYMVYWIAGNWFDKSGSSPWKCLVDHDGVFDNRMMGYATEELWFSEWENGGTPWDNPAGYEQFNPVLHVKDWKVPMLVIHNDLDYRIPVDQGIAAFTALQRRGIESRFLNFPDENHWVLKPQNSLLWHDTVNAWLKAHTHAAQ